MPDVSDLSAKGQELVAKAVGAADTVVDQITATANELLELAQDVQRKVVDALTSNA